MGPPPWPKTLSQHAQQELDISRLLWSLLLWYKTMVRRLKAWGKEVARGIASGSEPERWKSPTLVYFCGVRMCGPQGMEEHNDARTP
jgi:hypothetical protein